MDTTEWPTRCPRCQGFVVDDSVDDFYDPARWRCVNCGCRGEGWMVWGMVIGSYERAVHTLRRMGIKQQQDHSRQFGQRVAIRKVKVEDDETKHDD